MLARLLRRVMNADPVPRVVPGVIPEGFEELIEGAARAVYRKGEVFYNPAQVVNRDLSVLVLRWLQRERGEGAPPLRILEALSATGLRAVRYYREVGGVGCVVANDLDANAVETIARNVRHNGLDVKEQIIPNHGDAIEVMTMARGRDKQFHCVDLDPYGSAAPFLDSAVQAVTDGGLLAVTCTDLAVLCGNSPEICYGRYAATPLKGPTAHEMAVRIVFAAIQTAANRHGRGVEAVFCVKIDFYVRLFVRVRNSKLLAQQTPSNLALVHQCVECNTQRMQPLGRTRSNVMSNTARRKKKRAAHEAPVVPGTGSADLTTEPESAEAAPVAPADPAKSAPGVNKILKYSPALVEPHISAMCSQCNGNMLIGGPIWTGALIGEGVAESILAEIDSGTGDFKARERVSAMIRLLSEEVRDAPMFLHLPTMCKVLSVSPPPAASLRAVLLARGHSVSQSHTDPLAVKTNAPPDLLWDMLRLWVNKVGNPFTNKTTKKAKARAATSGEESRLCAGQRIMAKPVTLIGEEEIDFTVKKDKFVRRRNTGEVQAVRFPANPTPFWGPKARAGKRKRDDVALENVETKEES